MGLFKEDMNALGPKMKALVELGFEKSGSWMILHNQLTFGFYQHEQERRVLYAFSCNGELKYIGQTKRTLGRRMTGYKNASGSRSTDKRIYGNINKLLGEGHKVKIYVLLDSGQLNYKGYPVSLATGLEDTLIKKFRPDWNVV